MPAAAFQLQRVHQSLEQPMLLNESLLDEKLLWESELNESQLDEKLLNESLTELKLLKLSDPLEMLHELSNNEPVTPYGLPLMSTDPHIGVPSMLNKGSL